MLPQPPGMSNAAKQASRGTFAAQSCGKRVAGPWPGTGAVGRRRAAGKALLTKLA